MKREEAYADVNIFYIYCSTCWPNSERF